MSFTDAPSAPRKGGKVKSSFKTETPRPSFRSAHPVTFDVDSGEDYAQLLQAYDSTFKNYSEGQVVKGMVLSVTNSDVIVDVGFKSEGIISLDEFRDESGRVSIQPGDQIEVLLETTENRDGYVVLSREKAEKMKIWDDIERAYNEQSIITGRVIERIKGGLAVDVGIRAFLPGSQVDLHPVRNLDSLRGEELQMKVIKVNKRRGNIVLSRKIVLEEQTQRAKTETLKVLEEGMIIDGIVKNITDYGAFIDLGGIDGLLHITDMSWGRVNHPSELFRVGDKIQVKVLKFDKGEEKVSLGYKQLTEDPWETAEHRYNKGAKVTGKVVSLTDYGAFVELEPGVEGLIHISEMTWNKRIKHPSKLLSLGSEVESIVLDIDPEARRISLGLKQTEPNPWDIISEKYAVNSVITGKVRNLTDFGAFIEVEDGVDGLVHISDLSWSKKIKHPSEVLKKGDVVSAVVLNVDADNQRLSLGIKQLEPDKWEEFFSQHEIGDVVHGRIVRLTNFGAFVELAAGVEGLCHVSELDDKRIEKPEDHFSVGQELDLKIIKMNLLEKKIGLSLKAVKEDSHPEDDFKVYLTRSESASSTIGDIAKEQLENLRSQVQKKE
ncbi:MAG TPA: 30S ribosomal protein S1 [Acidobacteriota bacterium]|jgi:small subunit ribosomal protein S1|nr:30S ribosomal protein S1 [Acidobacteriota bacterium]